MKDMTKDVNRWAYNQMNIYEKLINIRRDFHSTPLKKSGRNNFAKYDYFELKDFIPTVIALCEKYKVLTVFNVTENTASMDVINAEKTDEVISFLTPTADAVGKGMLQIQGLGSQHTYLRRYLYINMLDIIENDIVDAQDHRNVSKEKYITDVQREKLFETYKGKEAMIQSGLQLLGIEHSSKIPAQKYAELIQAIDELIANA